MDVRTSSGTAHKGDSERHPKVRLFFKHVPQPRRQTIPFVVVGRCDTRTGAGGRRDIGYVIVEVLDLTVRLLFTIISLDRAVP